MWSRSGKSGDTIFKLTDSGYYEIQEPSTGVYDGKQARRYGRLDQDGNWHDCTIDDVENAFVVGA